MKQKEGKKMAKKEQRFSSFPDVVVGSIFAESWGWEQTNVSFYQVVSRTEKTVTIRQIGQIYEQETAMSGYVVPAKGRFIRDETRRKRLKENGKKTYLSMTSYSVANLTTENERHFTSSWA